MIESASSLYTKKACQPRVHRSHCDVVRTWNRFQLTDSVEDLHRTRCSHSTGAQDDRYLGLLCRRNRGLSAPDLNSAFEEAKGRHVSHQTVRKRLRDANLHSRRPCRAPRRTPQHHGFRYRCAINHAEWSHQDWRRVLFTDETRIFLYPIDRRRVWRQTTNIERLQHCVPRMKQGVVE